MNIIHVDSKRKLDQLCIELYDQRRVAFDTEGTSLNPYNYTPLIITLAFNETAYVIDLIQLNIDLVLTKLKHFFEAKDVLKIGHNLVYDWKILYHISKNIGRIKMECMHDVMTMDRCIHAGLILPGQFSLKNILQRRLNVTLNKEQRESFINWIPGQLLSPEDIEYAAKDTLYLFDVYDQQMQEIKDKKLDKIYQLEMDIISPTSLMEYTGVYVNRAMLEEMIEPFEHFVFTADKALQDMFINGGAADQILFTKDGYYCINSSSWQQVLAALHKVGVNIQNLNAKTVARWDLLQRKKKRKWTRDEEIDYHTLIDDDEVADALEAYEGIDNPYLRAYNFVVGARKLLSTYVYGLIDAIDPVTKRIHPYFNTYGAMATGRYSSNKPNFQNLPQNRKLKRLGLGRYSIRYAIEAPKGRKLIIADYSGIELVILAVLSGDEKLMYEIIQGDVHTYVTKEILKHLEITNENKDDEPHKTWRNGAKRVSYSIAYGTTGKNLSEQLNIDLAAVGFKISAEEGDRLIEAWYKLFPKTAAYLQKNAENAVLHGYVEDTWGRRRNWNQSLFVNKWLRLAAEREGKNMPIQGTSATMTKLAIAYLYRKLDSKLGRMVITVHDEIVLEVAESYTEEACKILKWCMEQAIRETLPSIANDVGVYKSLSVKASPSNRYDK